MQKSMVSYGQYSVHIEATATGQGQQAIGKLGLRAILVGILHNGVNVSIVSGCSIRLSSKAAVTDLRGGWDDPNCARPTRGVCDRALREHGDRPRHLAPFFSILPISP